MGGKNDPRERILVGFESRSAGGAPSMNRTTGQAGVARCMFSGRDIILWVLVRELSCSSVSGEVPQQCFSPFGIDGSSI